VAILLQKVFHRRVARLVPLAGAQAWKTMTRAARGGGLDVPFDVFLESAAEGSAETL